MSRSIEEVAQATIVSVPVEPWEKIHITGEQYVALTSSPEFLASTAQAASMLPFPLSMLLTPVMSEVKLAVVNALFTYDEAEVTTAIRKHCPEVAADFDAGVDPIQAALNAKRRALGEQFDEDDAA